MLTTCTSPFAAFRMTALLYWPVVASASTSMPSVRYSFSFSLEEALDFVSSQCWGPKKTKKNSHGSILILGLFSLTPFDALGLQIARNARQPLALLLQSLALNLKIRRLLGNLEFLRVQP